MSLPLQFKLNNGLQIPSVGLGTWQSEPGKVRKAVAHAIKTGTYHIDAAWAYQNQNEVGDGIKDSGVPREKLWITSKLFEFHHRPDLVRASCVDTLKQLDTPYLDAFLVHWPFGTIPEETKDGSFPRSVSKASNGKMALDVENSTDHKATWREMEKLVDEGLVKTIGISNFNIRKTRDLLKYARIKPALNQVELSLTCPQPELVEWLIKHDIQPQAYSPLGSTGAKSTTLEVVEKIAKKHNCTGANVIISWLVGRGINPLPKSVTPERIESNLKLVNLSSEEIATLTKYSSEQKVVRVCDQSEDVEPYYDIFESNHPEYNDAAQAKLGD